MDLKAKFKSKLVSIFSDLDKRAEAIAVLNSYGKESQEQEPVRVRLAVLKLLGTDPDIEKLAEITRAAKTDFRDVLAWAEYPRQSKHWSAKGTEKEKLLIADLNEYQEWLNT